jgi:ferrous iron transport protein B
VPTLRIVEDRSAARASGVTRRVVSTVPHTEAQLAADRAPDVRADVVLVGPPNVGKSALFGGLTKTYVTVSNYPGTTVEITRGRARRGGAAITVVDTPGVRSFIPLSEDERVTRDILLHEGARAIVAVGDAKNLVSTLVLALQLCEMELPFALCLNMIDEARERGIAIDAARLAERIGVDVVPTVAIRHKGLTRLRTATETPRVGRLSARYPAPIEHAAERVAALLPEAPIARRALALMILCGDETLVDWLKERVGRDDLARIEDLRQGLRRHFREPILYHVNRARQRAATEVAEQVLSRGTADSRGDRPITARLERWSVHPLWSLPLLGAVLYVTYVFVGVFGAGTFVGWLEEGLFARWINPMAIRLADRAVPWQFLRDMLVGPYGVVTMALTYAFALILPIVGTFFIAFGALEDSGYLPRMAVILNRVFKWMGLNGKAVLPMVLGLGCDTMATLTTRILETRKERLIVILLLSLGVPCSAQLTVILAMLGSISPTAVVVWLAVVAGVIVVVGALAARVLPGRGSDFIVELPPLRLPRLGNILTKTAARIEWYLKEAVPLFVLGTLILFLTDRVGLLERLRVWTEPVVRGWLGLPRETAEAFIIGFLRRDFGAAGLYQMTDEGRLDAIQVLVAAVTITLFIPCVAQFLMTVRERGVRTGIAIAMFVFSFALGAGAALNWLLRSLPFAIG